jgi:hypothetical protein
VTSPRGRPWTRAEYVAFVRAHHPDVGGDRSVFLAGMAEFRAARRGVARDPVGSGEDDDTGSGPPVPEDDEDDENDQDDRRFDGPVEVVVRPPPARRLVQRAQRWRDRRRRNRVE